MNPYADFPTISEQAVDGVPGDLIVSEHTSRYRLMNFLELLKSKKTC